MIIRVPRGASNPRVMMQQAGYFEFTDRNTGDISFVRRLGVNFYPRFHVYIQEEGDKRRINLHLDQKQASYQGTAKHNGEYSGPLVEEEAARIYQAVT